MTTSAPPAPVTAPSTVPLDAAPATAVIPEASVLTCTACGGDNAVDSRFCRHCGAALLTGEAAAKIAASPTSSFVTAQPVNDGAEYADGIGVAEQPNSGAEEVDKNRARHLLDRAERLSERGEFAASILACRQSIALSPQLVGGYALLGSLLERTNDTKGAVGAYEHVVTLWPDSPLERERLRSLRAQAAQNTSGSMFHFDANELFPETSTTVEAADAVAEQNVSETVTSSTEATAAPATNGASSSADSSDSAAQSSAASLTPVIAASVLPSLSNGSPPSSTPTTASGATNLTLARVALPSSSLSGVPSISAVTATGASGMNAADLTAHPDGAPSFAPLTFEPERATARRWESSYFWRGAPLSATVGTGLLFLIWAANWSAAHRSEVLVPATMTPSSVITDPSTLVPGSDLTGPGRLSEGAPGGGPNVIEPGAPATTPSGAAGAPSNANAGTNTPGGTPSAAQSGARPTNNAGGSAAPRGGSRPNTSQPSLGSANGGVRPLPILPRSVVPSSPDTTQDSAPRMSAPRIPAEAPPPISLGNNNDASSGTSTGGTPLNPVYGGGRVSIRLHTGPAPASAAPSRPSTQANSSERDANNAARSGQGSRAVNDASIAINRTGTGDPNLAYRYQTRALLFLENGDNARAIDDFNTAIQAYQDQIARGDQDQEARDGLEACRRGLRLAQRRAGR